MNKLTEPVKYLRQCIFENYYEHGVRDLALMAGRCLEERVD